MRIDSTITESHIHYPTDTSLLIDAMRLVVRTVKQSKQVKYHQASAHSREKCGTRKISYEQLAGEIKKCGKKQ